jgi:hypothetical protein
MDGRDAKSERRIVDPILLRNDFVAALRPVPVCVDDAGHHGHASGQECLRIVRNPDVYARTHCADPVALDYDDTVVDHFIAIHRNDSYPGDGNLAVGLVEFLFEIEFDTGRVTGLVRALGGVDFKRKKIRAQRPVQDPAVAGPVEVVARIVCQTLCPDRFHVRAHLQCLADTRNRQQVDLEAFLNGQPLAVRGNDKIAGELALGDNVLGAIGEAPADQQQFVVLALADQVEVIPVCPESGFLTFSGQEVRFAAASGYLVDAGVFTPPRTAQQVTRKLAVNDALTIGCETRLYIMARVGRYDFAAAAIGVNDAYRTEILIAPADIDDLAPVTRERRIEFEMLVLLGQSLSFAVREIPDVQASHRGKHDLLAVR